MGGEAYTLRVERAIMYSKNLLAHPGILVEAELQVTLDKHILFQFKKWIGGLMPKLRTTCRHNSDCLCRSLHEPWMPGQDISSPSTAVARVPWGSDLM